MAYSETSYIGDGSTNIFVIPFSYLERDDLKVYINDIEDINVSFISDTQIQTSSVPAIGDIITIQRETEKQRKVDFQNDSLLNESILDKDGNQLMYVVQEAYDKFAKALRRGWDNVWDALGTRIKNVAPPIEATDAVTKEYADEVIGRAQSFADLSEGFADLSEGFAGDSADSATLASIKADEANQAAIAAALSEGLANQSAINAAQSETQAVTSAAEAQSYRDQAKEITDGEVLYFGQRFKFVYNPVWDALEIKVI